MVRETKEHVCVILFAVVGLQLEGSLVFIGVDEI